MPSEYNPALDLARILVVVASEVEYLSKDPDSCAIFWHKDDKEALKRLDNFVYEALGSSEEKEKNGNGTEVPPRM